MKPINRLAKEYADWRRERQREGKIPVYSFDAWVFVNYPERQAEREALRPVNQRQAYKEWMQIPIRERIHGLAIKELIQTFKQVAEVQRDLEETMIEIEEQQHREEMGYEDWS